MKAQRLPRVRVNPGGSAENVCLTRKEHTEGQRTKYTLRTENVKRWSYLTFLLGNEMKGMCWKFLLAPTERDLSKHTATPTIHTTKLSSHTPVDNFSQLEWALHFIFMRITWAKLDWKVHQRESYPCSAADLLHPVLQPRQIQSPFTAHGECTRKINKCNATIYWRQIDFIPRQFRPELKCRRVSALRGSFSAPSQDYPLM